ncbi:hypothetical protein A2W14_04355 [Candidatus Gottesmanbacteria bacterium RBG_16_37_8]|uniref:Sodium/calcium exchanger membrane region domain-containing protein n=1 Tax=Candidatus Gottesmanbacteria bacterium RBG_16_37_8 TaxID=1798371 RepID=A0A1F5YSB1_9BACT|nr:MAG: hypothetical protein A2W14_04355 [Candidatus Gottesmanbacteria bacterium RBG_16_37_8]
MLGNVSLFLFALLTLWLGAGIIVYSLDKISKQLEISAFAVSFFILGLLTSLPELSVGINSILENRPEIFVGDLIGGSLTLFIFVIPLLAILSKRITLSHQMSTLKLIFSLYVVGLPAILIIDNNLTIPESLLLIFVYFVLFYNMEKRKGILDHLKNNILVAKKHNLFEFTKIIAGAFVVFMSSSILVEKTIYFSQVFKITPYLISLLVLSLGTNLPEISIALRSVVSGNKQIAFGNYLGSAATNTLLMGILTIFNRKPIFLENHFLLTFLFMATGLFLFYYFTRSKNDISRNEGVILIFLYLVFLAVELI